MGLVKQDTLHVANLPYHYQEDDLRELFKDCGEIKEIVLKKDLKAGGGKNLGFAFVTFAEDKGVRKGLNLSGHKIMKRPVIITIAKE